MRLPRWLGGPDEDPDEAAAAERAEEVRDTIAKLLTETKRQVAAIERRQRGNDGHAGHAGV